MARLVAVEPAQATGKAQELLNQVQAQLGITLNMMRTMTNSLAVLESYRQDGWVERQPPQCWSPVAGG